MKKKKTTTTRKMMSLPFNPTKIVVSVSFGKDSTAMLLKVLENYPKEMLIAHHQLIPEDWEGTVEYGRELCNKLGVELVVEQCYYVAFECVNRNCEKRWTSANANDKCPACKTNSGIKVMTIQSLTDLIVWRGMWPDMKNRYCTSYLKVMLFDKWVRANRGMLGHTPIVTLGERWKESPGRSKLPEFRERTGVRCEGFEMTEWRPILAYSRRDSFRAHRAAGIEPHPCYKMQGLTDYDMYELDVEGGPRMSCVCCIFNTPAQIKKNMEIKENKKLFNNLIEVEQKNQHYFKEKLSLKDISEDKHVTLGQKLQMQMELI